MLSRTIFMTTVTLGVLLTVQVALSQSKLNPGFNSDTGQINPGADPKLPSSQPASPVPTQEEVRAALMMTDPGTISTGEMPTTGAAAPPETTGKGSIDEQPGPIASTMQTKPAKFSHRNDVIDHTPVMAMPIRLTGPQRQQVYQAAMSDKAPAAEKLSLQPAEALPYPLVLKMHPLPASLSNMPALSKLDYVKSKDKVYLVTAQTAIVVDSFDGK